MKKHFKNITIFILAVVMCATFSVAYAAAQTYDYDELESMYASYVVSDALHHWAEETLKDAVASDILKGSGKDQYGLVKVKPNDPVTRAEFVTMLVRAMDLKSNDNSKTFSDVKTNDWFYEPVRIASALGIVQGVSENKFDPNRYVKRAEIAAIIYRAFKDSVPEKQPAKVFSDVPNYWATEAIEGVSKRKLVEGFEDNTFRPDKTATRAEAITIIMRALKNESQSVPSDEELKNIVIQHELERIQALQNSQWNELNNVNNKYATGKFWVENARENWQFVNFANIGVTFNVDLIGEFEATVMQKSDRFASVFLDGADLSMQLTFPDGTEDRSRIFYHVYHLKKMNDGNWKIYAITFPTF